MDTTRAPSRRRRVLGAALAIGSVAAMMTACTRGGIPGRTTTTWGPTPSTDCHGHTDEDHNNLRTTTTMGHGDHGGGDDHHAPGNTFPPCNGGGQPTTTSHGSHGGPGAPSGLTQAQIDKALKLVADTKAAVVRNRENTVAGLRAKGFFSIGDEMTGTTHYVHRERHYDGKELDPNAIEAFAVRGGQVIAAMYILENGKTMRDVPEIAGDWTTWHDHVLPFQSNNPRVDGYYKLGGMYTRRTAPMLHVWLVDNPCGPFAGTDNRNMTGSCENHGH